MATPDLAVTNLILPETPHPVDLVCRKGRVLEAVPHAPGAANGNALVNDGRGLTLLPG